LLLLLDRRRKDETPGQNRQDYADNIGSCTPAEQRVPGDVGITIRSA
jgi:hypothetical protein